MVDTNDLLVFRAEFKNEAGNPSDNETVYLDAVDREDAMKQVQEFIDSHPFDVVLKSLDQLDSTVPAK